MVLERIKEKLGFLKKEQLSTAGQLWLNRLLSGRYTLNKKLIEDIYQEKILTPHEEMRECRKMYLTNSHLVAGVETLKEIIIGDKITVESKDNKTIQFFEDFFSQSGFIDALHEAVENFIITGNGYIEKRGSITNPNMILKFSSIPMPELIYKDIQKGKLVRYILEYPSVEREEGIQYFTINYLGMKKSIRGKEIKPDKLIHLKYGAGAYSEYGRSPLASSINDGRILREIERAYALISRYKAVPRKIISIKNEDGTEISDQERQEFINNFSQLSDFENPIVGKKVELQDLSYGGKEVDLSPIISYLKEKQTLPLVPSFYISGKETTYAVSHDQKNIFFLKIKYLRRLISEAINPTLQQVAIQNNLDKKVKLKFGDFTFEGEKEKEERVIAKYNAGLITLEEARKELGLKKPKPTDRFKSTSPQMEV